MAVAKDNDHHRNHNHHQNRKNNTNNERNGKKAQTKEHGLLISLPCPDTFSGTSGCHAGRWDSKRLLSDETWKKKLDCQDSVAWDDWISRPLNYKLKPSSLSACFHVELPHWRGDERGNVDGHWDLEVWLFGLLASWLRGFPQLGVLGRAVVAPAISFWVISKHIQKSTPVLTTRMLVSKCLR